jgi:Flp pilus assembly pilin Flp
VKRGQGLIEYSVLLVLVAIALIVTLSLMGRQIQAAFQNVVNVLQGP